MSSLDYEIDMDVRRFYHDQIGGLIKRIDRLLFRIGHRFSDLISEYCYLLAVLIIGFVVWSVVFNIALTDYLNTSYWNSRTVWLGPLPNPGEFQIFGLTIQYQFEGFSDYSFYYVHWGHNMLNGVMPYTGSFGYLDMNGIINENGLFIFPPLTAYLYAIGIALEVIIGPGNWGIGLIFAIFGYATTLPVYGIARELSKNPRVGEIAALTYAINPLVLYHIDYLWLNPAPFYFFFFAGFYALTKGRKYTGTILIVTAALFKQTAWFLGIPLVIYLLVRPRERKKEISETIALNGNANDTPVENSEDEPSSKKKRSYSDYFDFKGFAGGAILAASYAGAILLPFIIAQPDVFKLILLALGSFSFDGNYVDPIPYNVPIRLPVIPIMHGMPEVAAIFDVAIVTSGPLFFGVVVFAGLMLLLDRYKGEEHMYLRKILFFTMLLMLWTNITGARGVFKYYFTLFGPFFSIFSSARMTRTEGEHVPVSASMIYMPILFSLLILIPDRNYYLEYVILIFALYLISPSFCGIYDKIKKPFRDVKVRILSRFKLEVRTTTIGDLTPDSIIYRILTTITLVFSLVSGSWLLIIGLTECYTRLTASLEVIMQFLLLMGLLVFIGVQMISIAANGFYLSSSKRHNLNYVIRTLSFTLMSVLFVFAIDTYILSWTVDLYIERQVMVISSVLMMIWALGLVFRIAVTSRLLSNLILLFGSVFGTLAWYSLGDVLFVLFGFTLISGLLLHLLLVINEAFVDRVIQGRSGGNSVPLTVEHSPG